MLRGRASIPPESVMWQRQEGCRKVATAALEASPELQRLASELIELNRRYLQERKEWFKDRWIVWSIPCVSRASQIGIPPGTRKPLQRGRAGDAV